MIFVAKLLQSFCGSLPLLHNNRGSFSYVSGATAHKIELSLVGSILIINDDTNVLK